MALRGGAVTLCLAFFLGMVSTTPLLATLIAAHDNATLQIKVTNIVSSTIQIFRDSLALNDLSQDHKVSAICDGRQVEFARVHFTRTLDPPTSDAFIALPPNHAITSEPFETTSLNVLGSATCVLSSQGSIMILRDSAATGNLQRQLKRIPYATEEIHMVIHNSLPTDLRLRDIGAIPLGRRADIKEETSCTASQKTSMEAAFKRAGRLAAYARDQIRQKKNPNRIWAYWLQDRQEVLDLVASNYELIRIYSTNSLAYYKNGTRVHYTCKDEWKHCNTSTGVIAYAKPILQAEGQRKYVVIVTCPLFWQMDLQRKTCPGRDRGSSMVHELSHAVMRTRDVSYGEEALKTTDPDDRLVNADNYELFAHDAEAGCPAIYDWPS